MTPEEFIDFLKESSNPMRIFSNDTDNKPLQTDREKIEEIIQSIMNANEILDRKITFTLYGDHNIIDIFRFRPYQNCTCYFNHKDADLQCSEILRTIQAWQSEKLEENIEEIYNEEQNADAPTPTYKAYPEDMTDHYEEMQIKRHFGNML